MSRYDLNHVFKTANLASDHRAISFLGYQGDMLEKLGQGGGKAVIRFRLLNEEINRDQNAVFEV